MRSLVSVIITTKNEEAVIEALLRSLKKQSYPEIEIIVVDNGSTDKTKGIAQNYTPLVFDKGPERSVQRNFGVGKSKGEYVLIIDADMQLERSVVEECVAEMEKNQEIGALVIPERSIGEGFWSKCKAFEREFYLGDESIEVARFFRKKLFEKYGGYDPSITGPEDADLPLRMKKDGVKIGRVKSFILHNEKRLSLGRAIKKKFYYASHSARYLQRHPEMSLSQGNLLFRPAFIKGWKKLIVHPKLASGMIFMRSCEMGAAGLGLIYSLALQKKP
jgi:cellulose synthase/poly-beta-1,6-N-acetylglucosamine synthase-like glycosyltransferase